MKISYRTHPALEYLKGNISGFKIFPEDKDFFFKMGDHFISTFENYISNFSKEILFISNPFFEASKKSFHKFDNTVVDFSYSGTIILNNTILFGFIYPSKNRVPKICFFHFTKQGTPICSFFQNISEVNNLTRSWFTTNKLFAGKDVYSHLNTLSLIYLFKKYAQVETKYLPPNKRVKDINCKYVNDTSLGITHLDSRWFTNLVKSDAFKVRGHFRLQPKKKDGEWTKELIWITDFEKKGYTSKARKLSLEGTSQPTTDNQ